MAKNFFVTQNCAQYCKNVEKFKNLQILEKLGVNSTKLWRTMENYEKKSWECDKKKL